MVSDGDVKSRICLRRASARERVQLLWRSKQRGTGQRSLGSKSTRLPNCSGGRRLSEIGTSLSLYCYVARETDRALPRQITRLEDSFV